ncbi:M20 family metallopeptidase [Fusobacterium sp.]|uniref:M20 metallopeptidase family protein n=1 Tax=Fusobacterium sp. TaxID=68766 RepID=UPI002609262D|nr:M20 family metallopeptidase [Fusobacterium sp.]
MEDFFYKTRCTLHQMPEIGLEEYKTSKFIREFLKNLEIEYLEIEMSTVAIFKGEEDRWIGFRADIDALPLQEDGEKEYKSKIDGMMHACGHDGHTTNLLYFAKWLKEQIESGKKLKKSVMLIFQSGEEGKGGARFVANSDFFKSKIFDGIFALHLNPGLEEGKIGTRAGAISFQNINLDIEIIGKGSHGAEPHKGIDSILIGAKLVEAYQSIISRNLNPLEPAILTIGSFKAGEVRNIIPEKVNILGTIRFSNRDLIEFFRERITNINKGLELAFGVKINMEFNPFYPPVVNDVELFKKIEKIVPKEDFIGDMRFTASEDFSFYLQSGNKGLMFLLGTRNEEKNFIYPLHNPKFDFNPEVLKKGFTVFKDLLIEMDAFK